MSNGDVQREVKMLKTLEKIEEHLGTLVNLALASGIASSTERTETRDYRDSAKGERADIKDAVQ